MKILLWLFLIALIVCFSIVIAQQISARVQPDQKYEACRVEAESLTWYAYWSFLPFGLLYWGACMLRWKGLGPIERLVGSVLLTLGMSASVLWRLMDAKFHDASTCSGAPLPLDTFLSAWISPLYGIVLLTLIGITWNLVRVRRVAPREA